VAVVVKVLLVKVLVVVVVVVPAAAATDRQPCRHIRRVTDLPTAAPPDASYYYL
jgi:hypothetical protein